MISVSPNEIVNCIAGTKNYADDEFKERRFDFLKTEPIIVETYHAPDGLTTMLYRIVGIYFFHDSLFPHSRKHMLRA
jgi:hypothetical protein